MLKSPENCAPTLTAAQQAKKKKSVYKFFKKSALAKVLSGILGKYSKRIAIIKKSLGSLLLDPTPHSDINILGASVILFAYLKLMFSKYAW